MPFHLAVTNLARRSDSFVFSRDDRVVERRVELAAQHVALTHLGSEIEPDTELLLHAAWKACGSVDSWIPLESVVVEVLPAEGGEPIAAEEISTSELMLLEVQALVQALSTGHNIFRAGEQAAGMLQFEGGQLEPMDFTYRVPGVESALAGSDPARISAQAASVVSSMLQEGGGKEQCGFAIGVSGPGPNNAPLVTDVFIPETDGESSATTVDFTPEAWSAAHSFVERAGYPFRIIGPLHTHPPGSLSPSPDDWDVFLWGGDASSLFVIASEVRNQPVVAGYRWVRGTLRQVSLEVIPEPVPAAGAAGGE